MKPAYIGIDLSGPANFKDTCLCIQMPKSLKVQLNASDQSIYQQVQSISNHHRVYIAIDSPLSYQEGGGYRDVDQALRNHINSLGFSQLGVMAPTFNRMVYLTLRGLRLVQILSTLPNVKLFETHPGSALALSGAAYDDILEIKRSDIAKQNLQTFLSQALNQNLILKTDHEIMAVAAMLSAKRAAENHCLFEFNSNISLQPKFVL